jgi:hypothetical protein
MSLRVISAGISMAKTWHAVCYREGQEERNMAHETKTNHDRLYDVLTIPCNSDGAPCNLAAERCYMTQAQIHDAVMYPLYKGYSRYVEPGTWNNGHNVIRVATYDEAGVLYELLVIGRAS